MSEPLKSNSQLGQDLEVLKFYNNKRNGFFVEIGASDGIELSNTFLLENNFGWRGICVEPIPAKFGLLCNNRLNSVCYQEAVYDETGKPVVFDICNQADMLSGISDNIDCHKTVVNQNKTQITVNTISLNDLLDKSNSPTFIEYLSLDTEGSELEILKSVDFQKYTFGLIDVEHNYMEPRRSRIRELLTSNGYHYVRENKFDDSYRHTSVHACMT
jgi:FkbM family methyltransferase